MAHLPAIRHWTGVSRTVTAALLGMLLSAHSHVPNIMAIVGQAPILPPTSINRYISAAGTARKRSIGIMAELAIIGVKVYLLCLR